MKFVFLYSAIGLGILLTTAADVFLKRSNGTNVQLIAIGLSLYALVALPVAFAFRLSTFGGLFLVWEGLYISGGLLTASIVFGEPLTTRRALALLLAILALVLSYDIH